MFNKVLVGIDRSSLGREVFDVALSVAAASGAKLMLLHVLSEREQDYPEIPTYSYYPLLNEQTVQLYQQQWEEYKNQGLELLETLTAEATDKGISTEFTQIAGSPERFICELAETWQADLIIVGSRGLRGVKEMFLGSVSNYVTHHAPCSVLIVRQKNQLQSESVDTSETDLTTSQS